MHCRYCKIQLSPNDPHVTTQHFEFGEYGGKSHFCNLEHQAFSILVGRWGYSREDAEMVLMSRPRP